MYRIYNKAISIIIIISLLSSNSLWALAPEDKLDELKYAKVIVNLFQVLDGARGQKVSLPQNLALSLDPKDRVLYLYSKNPQTRPGVIYRIYTSGRTPPAVSSKPIHAEDIGRLRIEVYTRTNEWDRKIGAGGYVELTDAERTTIQEFIDATDNSLLREVLERLLPLKGSILEINARAWGKRFKDISEDDLRTLKEKGYDTIWMMGIWGISPKSAEINKGVGSAYAITDYKINPDLGTEDEFIEFSKRAKGLGLRVVVDFIPNHMAMDSPWIDGHPEWFMPHWAEISDEDRARYGTMFFERRGKTFCHGADKWGDKPWTDTAQLNLANAELRKHLIATLKWLARLSQSGGVRCDMAMLATKAHIRGMWFGFTSQEEFNRLMPQEFWEEVINEVKKEYPDFKFIAETYWKREGDLQKMGFDATYDEYFYNCLKEGRIGELKGYIRGVPKDYLNRAVHYLSNHDERNPLGVFGSLQQYKAASVIQGIMPGRLLYYLDQVEGKTELSRAAQLPRGVKTNAGIARFYSKLIPVLSLPIFRQGDFELIDVSGEGSQNVFAIRRIYGDQRAISVVNYSNQSSQTKLGLDFDGIEDGNSYLLEDLVSGKKKIVRGKELKQYELDIEPWGYHIFTITDRGKIVEQEEPSGVSVRAPPERRFSGTTNEIDEAVDGRIVKIQKYKGSDIVFYSLKGPSVTPENVAELIAHEQERFVEAYDASVETLEVITDTAGLRDAVLAGIDEEKMNAEFVFIKMIDKEIADARNERVVELLNRLKSKVIDHLTHQWSLAFEGDSGEIVRKRIGLEIGKFVRVINRLIQKQVNMQHSYDDPELRSRIGSVIAQLKVLRKEIGKDIKESKEMAIYLLYKKTREYEEALSKMKPSQIRDGLEEMLRVNIMVIEELRMGILIKPGMSPERKTRIKQGEVDRFRSILAEVKNAFSDKDIIAFLDRLGEEVPREVMEKGLSAGLVIFAIFEGLSISDAVRTKILKAVNMLIGKMYERERDFIADKVKEGKVILVYEGLPLTYELVELLELYEDRIVAILSDVGTGLSHFNLVAKGEGIVALTAVKDTSGKGCFNNVKEGDLMLVYGDTGELIVNPKPAAYFNFLQKALERRVFQEYCRRKTTEPVEMDIMVNADNPKQVRKAQGLGASGVGLIRTEYLYGLEKPKEEELIKVFRRFAQETSNKVTIRIFDRQPDKITRGLVENGVYGFEYYFTREGREATRSEIRAALIAARDYPNIRIMFPLVNDENDAGMAIDLVNSIREELIGKGLITREQAYGVKIGFMVETVAAVENIWKLLERADFVSLGTNDLTKSVFGLATRDDPSNADKFNRLQPAVLRMVARAVKAVMDFNSGLPIERHKEISICGDLASMHEFTPFVAALRYKYPQLQLVPSVPYKTIPVIKELRRRLDAPACYQLFMPVIDNGKPAAGDLHEDARYLIEEVLDEIKNDEQYIDLQRAADEELERELERLGRLHRGGAIGKASCLEEKDEVVVEDMNPEENAVIREVIDRIRELIARARLKDTKRRQAEEALALLEGYFRGGKIKVFDARVKGYEDYLLAFPRERDHIIALARDLLDPEILFHEGFAARFGERDLDEHRRIYKGIQRKIFGKANLLKDKLRRYINNKAYLNNVNRGWSRTAVGDGLVKVLLHIRRNTRDGSTIRIYPGSSNNHMFGGIYKDGRPILLLEADRDGIRETRKTIQEEGFDWEWIEEHFTRVRVERILLSPRPLTKIPLLKTIYEELGQRLEIDDEEVLSTAVYNIALEGVDAFESVKRILRLYEEKFTVDLRGLDNDIKLELMSVLHVVGAERILREALRRRARDIKGITKILKVVTERTGGERLKKDSIIVFSLTELYSRLVHIIDKDITVKELKDMVERTSPEELEMAFRVDNGVIDQDDLRQAEEIAKIVDRFYWDKETKLRLVQALVILIRDVKGRRGETERLKEMVKGQIGLVDALKARIDKKCGYVLIDKEYLPPNQRYILEKREWSRRKVLLEKIFPGYSFDIFTGRLESHMNRDNTIILTSNKGYKKLDARILFIKDVDRYDYFPFDSLVLLGIGMLNLSRDDIDGSPLRSTLVRLYKEITGEDLNIQAVIDSNYVINILLPPIRRLKSGELYELHSYAISLLEQAA